MIYTVAFTIGTLLITNFSFGLLEFFSRPARKGMAKYPAFSFRQSSAKETVLVTLNETQDPDSNPAGTERNSEVSILQFPLYLN